MILRKPRRAALAAIAILVAAASAASFAESGPSTAPPVPPATEPVPPTPSSEDPALAAYRASVASGSPLSARRLAAQHDIGRRQAGRVVAQVSHEANGHSNRTEQDQETR